MSDGPMGFFFGQIPTDEERNAYQAMLDRNAMATEVINNDIHGLFGEITPKQLATLRFMFHTIVTVEEPKSYAAYFEGQAAAVLKLVHKVCSGCGEDHAQDLCKKETPEEGSD